MENEYHKNPDQLDASVPIGHFCTLDDSKIDVFISESSFNFFKSV